MKIGDHIFQYSSWPASGVWHTDGEEHSTKQSAIDFADKHRASVNGFSWRIMELTKNGWVKVLDNGQ